MRISNSSIQTFKRCPRLWELQYIHNLYPTAPAAEPLAIGSTYHDKLEQLIKTGEYNQTADPKTDAMVHAFKCHIMPKISQSGDTFQTEKWFEYTTKSGNVIVGRYDGIGTKNLLEHKTTSSKIDGNYWLDVLNDEQVLTYMMASGLKKVLYTVCQKPTLRQSKNEPFEDYVQRCKDWYNTDTESKIDVSEITHTSGEVKLHEMAVDAMCATIANCKNFYQNRAYCKHWGRMCDYAPICNDYVPGAKLVGFEQRLNSFKL